MEASMNQRRKTVAMIALTLALAVPLAGCAGKTKVRRTAKQMCEAHGGQYNAQTQQCSYVAQQRTARQNCESQGGVYWPAEQYCDFEE
jgi:hypothetical protein